MSKPNKPIKPNLRLKHIKQLRVEKTYKLNSSNKRHQGYSKSEMILYVFNADKELIDTLPVSELLIKYDIIRPSLDKIVKGEKLYKGLYYFSKTDFLCF